MWKMRQEYTLDMFDLQMQQAESGEKIWDKIWMSVESTLRGLDIGDILTYGILQEEKAISVVISKTDFGPEMMLMFVTW